MSQAVGLQKLDPLGKENAELKKELARVKKQQDILRRYLMKKDYVHSRYSTDHIELILEGKL
jgi:hypothetical protein